MCGRYALAGDWSDFTQEFGLEEVPGLPSRYNIAPTSGAGFESPIFVGQKELVPARFWFVPSFWQKSLKELPTSFNARSETALEKPFFRGAERCLIPTSGWREFPGPAGRKKAFSFELRKKSEETPEFFAFGGLCSKWRDAVLGETVYTFAILTTESNGVVRPYHDRMPLVVPRSIYGDWLNADARLEDVLCLARDHTQALELFCYECSTFGNSTRVEGPGCIEPVREQTELFR